jgi:transposase-like protein
MSRTKRHYSEEIKQRVVEDYVSGRKTAQELATELGVAQGLIYKWKVRLEEHAKGQRIEEMQDQGMNPESARRFLDLEAELAEYKKKVGEQAVIIDLLKKLQPPNSPLARESNGLGDIMKQLDRSKRPVK